MHFFSSHHTPASNTAYIIPSYSFSYSLSQAGKKKKPRYLTYTCRPYFSLTHTYYFYPSKTPSLHILSLFTLRSLFYIILCRDIMENSNVASIPTDFIQYFECNTLTRFHVQPHFYMHNFPSSSIQLPLTEM